MGAAVCGVIRCVAGWVVGTMLDWFLTMVVFSVFEVPDGEAETAAATVDAVDPDDVACCICMMMLIVSGLSCQTHFSTGTQRIS